MSDGAEKKAQDAIDRIADAFSPDDALAILSGAIGSQIYRAAKGNPDRVLMKLGAVIACLGDSLSGVIQTMRLES